MTIHTIKGTTATAARLLLCLSLLFTSASPASLNYDLPPDKRYAYVTLLYNDDFAFAVRTLGQSLRETKNHQRSNIDHLVLVTSGVTSGMQEQLEGEGWKVKRVKQADNPNASYDKRLKGVYTKLEIFRLTEYHRVVYLDADTTAIENVDELFLCGPFCAVMRHSELINTGVIVVEPSLDLHTDFMSKVSSLYSYTGGDQGFLNSYFTDYADCPYFEPMKNIGLSGDAKCRRLPHRYNGDWPIAMLNGKLEMVRTKNSMEKEFGEFRRSRILHYTVGSFKPWDWYAPAIFPFTQFYTTVAARVPKTAADHQQTFYEFVLILFGLALFGIWMALIWSAPESHRQVTGTPSKVLSRISQRIRIILTPRSRFNIAAWTRDPLSRGCLVLHLLTGYVSLLLGTGIGFMMVPRETRSASMGFSIFLVWTFGVFFSSYSLYLCRCYLLGVTFNSEKSADVESNSLFIPESSSKNNIGSLARARSESMAYASFLMISVVWFVIVRVRTPTESLGQVLPSLIGLIVSLVFGLTVVFYRLPLLWYQEGRCISK